MVTYVRPFSLKSIYEGFFVVAVNSTRTTSVHVVVTALSSHPRFITLEVVNTVNWFLSLDRPEVDLYRKLHNIESKVIAKEFSPFIIAEAILWRLAFHQSVAANAEFTSSASSPRNAADGDATSSPRRGGRIKANTSIEMLPDVPTPARRASAA